jgi:CTP synthase
VTGDNVADKLGDMAGILICPGFGQRGIEGKIIAAQYGRTHDVPTFGICLGMQMMVIEFARNVLGYKDANSAEMRPTPKQTLQQQTLPQPLPVMEGSSHQEPVNVIDLMEEQKSITEMGGTMRLGAYDCKVLKGSKSFDAYSQSELSTPLHNREGLGEGLLEGLLISERHRHRYEFNNAYKEEYEKKGMRCVGINPAANLVEIVEIPENRWYIGTQFHPEYSSTVLHPHPLFLSFLKACLVK